MITIWSRGEDWQGGPLLAVDAGDGGQEALVVPSLLPAVVAIVGGPAPAETRRALGADVALTTATHPGAPWVTVDNVDDALANLQSSVARCPVAAVTLVQLLRLHRPHLRPTDHGLLLESLAYSDLQASPEFARWREEWAAGRAGSRPRPPEDDPVLAERRGDVLHLTLNRPQVHNAYSRAMRDRLYELLSVAAEDQDLSVEISGQGKSFCSGGDLTEFGTAPDPATANLVRTGRSPARLLAALAPRVRVTVQGVCAGSGIELPAFAGWIRAHRDTRMWLPELAMGLIPGAGGTTSVTARIGPARTAWMALSGEAVDVDTGLEWGLIDEIMEP